MKRSGEMRSSLRIQLWSYNYAPEPTGIGPVSRAWACAMRDRGHEVYVIAAHPHYPEPRWGTRIVPYREARDGIPILRLPLWIGRASTGERYRQELSFMISQLAVLPGVDRADVVVSVSPCFPALLPAIVNAWARRTPWVIWLQDILPDGATATGMVESGVVLRAARGLERAAHQAASRIVVPSRSFTRNLAEKGVPESKVKVVYNPATRAPSTRPERNEHAEPLRILSMGNIGQSQGLASIVRAFERHGDDMPPARLVITGTGVAADEVRAEICSERVRMLGLIDGAQLEEELAQAALGLVSQHHLGAEFNIPSKLMNFMAHGLPVIAVVNPGSEVARIVEESQAGWVVSSSNPSLFPAKVREIAASPCEWARCSAAAFDYAARHFGPASLARDFTRVLDEAVA